ncbi:hypothetical protein ACH4T9_12790 [Micromonospora sp. NPDC020750]|uniref:hypothetical protein n=1 Tax=unclassified Micromonospora TaxID=2617518 RepID=UPI00378D9FB0
MADPTDVTLPITPARIGSAVDAIVEKALPSPFGELCAPVGLMKRELAAHAGRLVQAAYDDAASINRDARQRLARHLFLSERTDEWAPREWDLPQHVNQKPYLRRADALLAVITGKEPR